MILGDFKVSWRISRRPGGTSKDHGGSKSSLGTFFLEYLKDFLGNIRDPGDLKVSRGNSKVPLDLKDSKVPGILGVFKKSWETSRDIGGPQVFLGDLKLSGGP